MTIIRPGVAPHVEIIENVLMTSSGQKSVATTFGRVVSAIPVAVNQSSYVSVQFNGYSVNYSGSIVDVFANCSGDDDSGSGVFPNTSMRFDLIAYGLR